MNVDLKNNGEAYYKSLLINKEKFVLDTFKKEPQDLVGITKEEYMNYTISSRYGKLCEAIRLTKHLDKQPKIGVQGEIDLFKSFLKIAASDEREAIMQKMRSVIEKNDMRKQLEEELKAKQKELRELEDRISKIL
jgi:hypothetical protein